MPPKPSEAQLRKKWEKEQVRKRVLELHSQGGLTMAQIGAHQDVRLAKQTVWNIINTFGKRGDVQAKKQPGKPSRITQRCVLRCL